MATVLTTSTRSLVLYPSPGMGHLVSMVELAKLLINHNFTVTIIILSPTYNTGSTASFIARVASANPSISFHHLPPITPPPNPSPHHEAIAFDLIKLSNPNLHDFLQSSSPTPSALVIDFFCTTALDVAFELEIPTYIFFTSGAGVLSVFLHFPEFHSQTTSSPRELGYTQLHFPGFPPLPANHLPLPMLDRDDNAYKGFLHIFKRFRESNGIIVNTFDAIEKQPIHAIISEPKNPPLYCIGPLITEDREQSSDACLTWLDSQPPRSVVFLCFGSIGLFSEQQLKEIATGLENSMSRFLWVVRSPPSSDPSKRFSKPLEPELNKLLPDGFLDRTKDRGLVVKSWAPQGLILKHGAVGGFVSHCGWNSTLEAVCNGVPIIAWPLYAEQWMNKVLLVEECKLAVEMEGYDKEVVSGEEVERKMRWLMESEGGKELRKRMVEMKEKAAVAVAEGGSSFTALVELVEELKQDHKGIKL